MLEQEVSETAVNGGKIEEGLMSENIDNKRHKTKYPGVYYRVCKRRGKVGTERVYYVTYWQGDRKREVKAGRQFVDDMTEAKASYIRARLIENEIKPPQDKRREDASRMTIGKVWEAYKDANGHKRVTRGYEYIANKHLKYLFSKHPSGLKTKDVEALRTELEKIGHAPASIRQTLGLLKRILQFGVKRELCEVPASLNFEMPKIDNQRTECLTREELQRLFEVLDAEKDQIQASLMRFALATGMRHGALLALEWRDVDFEAGFITLRGEVAKSGKTSRIPMNQEARSILESVPVVAGSAYVFPKPSGEKRHKIQRFTDRISKAAKLPEGFRPMHGLRHTYASYLASSGEVDLYTLQKLLTHNSPRMTERYAHLTDDAMKRAASVAGRIFEKDGKNKTIYTDLYALPLLFVFHWL